MMSTTDRQQQAMDALHRPPAVSPRNTEPMGTAAWWRRLLPRQPDWWAKVYAEPFGKEKADG